jgi:glycosyltransferase involved in cell wall biosynthesis
LKGIGLDARNRIAYLSSYPPRECGIANYTKDLVDAIQQTRYFRPPTIIAVNDPDSFYHYPRQVKFQIQQDDIHDYQQASQFLAKSRVDLVNLQHEFGIFGGKKGKYVQVILNECGKPFATTLHTVNLTPSPLTKRTLAEICQRSQVVVVMAKKAAEILRNVYDVTTSIRVIPHGFHDRPISPIEKSKKRLGLEHRVVLSTFGLLHRQKGIEYVLHALPEIVKQEPRILYLVIGETHPEVRRREGEAYRNRLSRIVKRLDLRRHVKFYNRYLNRSEILNHLQATDIYLTPYLIHDQLSSGTLTYALGMGKAIISTPFLYAQETLTDERGLLCDFADSTSIAQGVRRLLVDSDLKTRIEENAYRYGRSMTWPKVASQYISVFHDCVEQ